MDRRDWMKRLGVVVGGLWFGRKVVLDPVGKPKRKPVVWSDRAKPGDTDTVEYIPPKVRAIGMNQRYDGYAVYDRPLPPAERYGWDNEWIRFDGRATYFRVKE